MKRRGKDDGKKDIGRHRVRFLLGGLVCLLGLACAAAVFYDGGDGGTSGLSDQEAPGVPELSGEVNRDSVMALLNAYDKDGAYLVDYGSKKGDDWLGYYGEGAGLLDSLDTVVHEEYHIYSEIGEDSERLYGGDGRSVEVAYTETFPTREMADSVPRKYHGIRYMAYISEPGGELLANVKGAYGLLNELGAYSWGMDNAVAMYPYYDQSEDNMDTWGNFISKAESNKLAYAEMKYYLLYYLRYAKKNHPEDYQQIIGNEEFRLAYKDIDARFAGLIADYDDDLTEIEAKLQQAGYEVEHTSDEFIVSNAGRVALYTYQYDSFLEEMAKEPYASIHRKLTGETDEN